MPASYDSFRNLATRLIARRGRAITLNVQPDQSGPDEAPTDLPWKVEFEQMAMPDPIDTVGVIFPIMHKRIDGTVVQATDKTAFVSAQAIGDHVVSTQDTIVDSKDGAQYAIVEAQDISPGAPSVLWVLQLRGS